MINPLPQSGLGQVHQSGLPLGGRSVPQGDIIVTVEELWKALPAWISSALLLFGFCLVGAILLGRVSGTVIASVGKADEECTAPAA